MVRQCASFGGLNHSSVKDEEPPSWKQTGVYYKSYRCVGLPTTLKPIERVTTPNSGVVNPQNSISIDGAKNKCVELGFRQETEGFGKCVLQLTK
jgi:hypothetical protein